MKDEYLDYPGLQRYTEHVQGEIDQLNSSLNDKLMPTDYSAAIALSGATGASGNLNYCKIGKIVHVFGYVTSSITTDGVTGMFPGLPKPLAQFNIPTSITSKFVQLRTDGGLRNYACCSNTAYFNFCYPTSE